MISHDLKVEQLRIESTQTTKERVAMTAGALFILHLYCWFNRKKNEPLLTDLKLL